MPVLQTGVFCGDVCVNMMWAATSPSVAAKSSMWPQYRYIFIQSKTGILNLFTNGEMVHLWLSKVSVGFVFPPPLYLTSNTPPEVKVSVEGVSDSLTWGTSASRMKWGVFFLLADRRSRKWPNCFPVLHFVAFHQSTESLMAFSPLFLPICGTPSKSSSQSLKTL